jgi:hypothetical protein
VKQDDLDHAMITDSPGFLRLFGFVRFSGGSFRRGDGQRTIIARQLLLQNAALQGLSTERPSCVGKKGSSL